MLKMAEGKWHMLHLPSAICHLRVLSSNRCHGLVSHRRFQRFLSCDQRLNLVQMLFGLLTPQGDILPRTPEIMPSPIEGKGPQHDVRALASQVGDAHLRAIETAQDGV